MVEKKKFLEKHKDLVQGMKNFSFFIFGYGFLINYVLKIILDFEFSILTLMAWGVLYYFISEEFTEWFSKLRAKRIR